MPPPAPRFRNRRTPARTYRKTPQLHVCRETSATSQEVSVVQNRSRDFVQQKGIADTGVTKGKTRLRRRRATHQNADRLPCGELLSLIAGVKPVKCSSARP